MQKTNVNLLVSAGQTMDDPIAKAIRQSTEVGVVVPSILRDKLTKAGYRVVSDPAILAKSGYPERQHLKQAAIYAPGPVVTVIGYGASDSEDDAMLHAVLGYVRERLRDGEADDEKGKPGK